MNNTSEAATQAAATPTKSHWPVSILSTFSSLVNMLLPLILVRLLKPEEIGLFKIFFLYLTIFPAFSFMTGVLSGLPYWAGQPHQRGRAALRMSSTLIAISAVLLLAVTWSLRPQIAAYLGWQMIYVNVLCVGLLGTLSSAFYEETAIAMGKIWAGAIFSSGLDLLRTLTILVTAIVTHNLAAIFVAHISVLIFKTLLGYFLGWREGWVGFKWDPVVFKAVWKYAFPVSVAWGFGIIVNFSDQVILSKYVLAADFAFYSIGCLTVPPLIILEASVARVLIPQLAGVFTAGESFRAAALFRKAVADLAYLTIPAVAGMMIFAAPIIEMLFTHRYSSAAGFMQAYALYYLVQIFPHDSVPRARGEGRWILTNFIFFSLLTLGSCWVLTVKFGPWGALSGLVVSRAMMKVYAMTYIKRTTDWKWSDFLPMPQIARSTVVCAGLGVLCLALRPLYGDAGLFWFLSCGALFSFLYFALTMGWSHWLDRRSITEPKVLMLTQHLGIGGLERMILNLAVTLKAESQWRPEVFVYDHLSTASADGDLVAAFAEQGIPVEVFSKGRGFSPKAVFKITKLILDRKIQVVHSHDLGALIYGVCAKLAAFGRVRLIHTQHSFVHIKRLKRYEYYEKIFTFFADELTVVSNATRDIYVSLGVPTRKIHVIPNGVAFAPSPILDASAKRQKREELFTAIPALAEFASANWLLYMARIHGRKGQDHALKLWGSLPESVRRSSVLIFVGPETEAGQLRSLENGIAASPHRERIVIAGPAQKPLIWLEASDVYLSCSEFEGMPLGPIEAAGSGLPLLLSRIPGHSMLENRSYTYLLEDPAAGAERLQAALSASGTAEGFAALKQVSITIRAGFALGGMARLYAALYGKGWVIPVRAASRGVLEPTPGLDGLRG